jgi:hypothetical protein
VAVSVPQDWSDAPAGSVSGKNALVAGPLPAAAQCGAGKEERERKKTVFIDIFF